MFEPYSQEHIAEELYAMADEILKSGRVSRHAHDMLAERYGQLVQEHMVRGLLEAEDVKVGLSQSQKKAVVRLTDGSVSDEAKSFRLAHIKRYLSQAITYAN